MFRKLLFVILVIIVSVAFATTVSAADTYPKNPYLYDDENGITTITTSFDKFVVIGNFVDKRPADFKNAKAYIALYNSGNKLDALYVFSDLNGKSIDQKLSDFKKGSGMYVRLFVWNEINPLYNAYDVTYC